MSEPQWTHLEGESAQENLPRGVGCVRKVSDDGVRLCPENTTGEVGPSFGAMHAILDSHTKRLQYSVVLLEDRHCFRAV